MDVRDGFRRWYELNARLFGKLHQVADVVAGLAFLVIVLLLAVLAQAWFDFSVAFLPDPSRSLAMALYAAIGLFVVAVLVQTLAGLRSFFSRLFARLLE